LTKHVCEIGSVAHQPAGYGINTGRITRWNSVVRCPRWLIAHSGC
jgi:hypothetical protein